MAPEETTILLCIRCASQVSRYGGNLRREFQPMRFDCLSGLALLLLLRFFHNFAEFRNGRHVG